MAYELVYTSVAKGLKAGSSGFCTAAYTNGLAANIVLRLEGLSAYKTYFPHYDENASKNPVSYVHYKYNNAGKVYHILSRICFYGVDYTKRSNKLAHHLVLEEDEIKYAQKGPTSVFRQENLFREEWNEESKLFQKQLKIEPPKISFKKAQTWENYTSDAAWAGVLAQFYLDNPKKVAFIIFDPMVHDDILSLVEEAISLLPPHMRWDVTFNTYFTALPAGITCNWRFCTSEEEVIRDARRLPGSLIINLSKAGIAPDGELQECARNGVRPKPKIIGGANSQQNSISPEINIGNISNKNSNNSSQVNNHIKKGNNNLTNNIKNKKPIIIIIVAVLLIMVAFVLFNIFSLQNIKQNNDAENKHLSNDNDKEITVIKDNHKPDNVKLKESKPDNVKLKESKPDNVKLKESKPDNVKLKESKPENALKKKIIANANIVWLDNDYTKFKSSKSTIDNILLKDEKIIEVFINEEWKHVNDGIVEKKAGFVGFCYKYRLGLEGGKLTIENKHKDLVNNYLITKIKTNKNREIYFKFELGKTIIPEDNAKVVIDLANKKISYQLTDNDKKAENIIKNIFNNAKIRIGDIIIAKFTLKGKKTPIIIAKLEEKEIMSSSIYKEFYNCLKKHNDINSKLKFIDKITNPNFSKNRLKKYEENTYLTENFPDDILSKIKEKKIDIYIDAIKYILFKNEQKLAQKCGITLDKPLEKNMIENLKNKLNNELNNANKELKDAKEKISKTLKKAEISLEINGKEIKKIKQGNIEIK